MKAELSNKKDETLHYGLYLREKALRARAEVELAAVQQELAAWRSWAQFVYLGGGPVTKADGELRQGVCEKHDAELTALRAQQERLRDFAVHDVNCAVWPGGHAGWREDDRSVCTCGLAAAVLDAPESKP